MFSGYKTKKIEVMIMVYLFLADGFEEIEALTPVDMLRRAGIEVTTVSVNSGKEVCGTHGIKVVADRVIEETPIKNVDMVVLPGGLPGADNLRMNKRVNEFIDFAVENNAFVCAICAAPRILGEKSLLKGKKAVCYPGFEKYLEGAEIVDLGCVRDGNIITSKGMGKANEFGLALVEALKDKETAGKIKASVFA